MKKLLRRLCIWLFGDPFQVHYIAHSIPDARFLHERRDKAEYLRHMKKEMARRLADALLEKGVITIEERPRVNSFSTLYVAEISTFKPWW